VSNLLIDSLQDLAREHASELGLLHLAQELSVVWNKRMRSTAGRAYYQELKIELNPKLAAISADELHRTLLHELAHLVAHVRNASRKIAPHGVEWREACRDLGIPNEKVTHDLPLPVRKQARNWHYTCAHCKEVVTRVRRVKGRWLACHSCCKKYNKGRYHSKFKLVESYHESVES